MTFAEEEDGLLMNPMDGGAVASEGWCERFLAQVRSRSTSTVLPFVWVAGAVFDGTHAVVIYREEGSRAPLVGRVYEAAEQIRSFFPSSPEEIADAAVAGDLTDPSGPGERSSWPWAQELVGTDEPIGWHGPLPANR